MAPSFWFSGRPAPLQDCGSIFCMTCPPVAPFGAATASRSGGGGGGGEGGGEGGVGEGVVGEVKERPLGGGKVEPVARKHPRGGRDVVVGHILVQPVARIAHTTGASGDVGGRAAAGAGADVAHGGERGGASGWWLLRARAPRCGRGLGY